MHPLWRRQVPTSARQRAETIARISTGRRYYPGIAEKTIAYAKIQAAGHGQIRLGQGVGVVVGLFNRAFASRIGRSLQWVFDR